MAMSQDQEHSLLVQTVSISLRALPPALNSERAEESSLFDSQFGYRASLGGPVHSVLLVNHGPSNNDV